MAVSGRTARRLAAGPTLLLAAEVSDEMADALLAYDPALRVRSDRFAFGNGVLLHGPVDITPELAAKAGLPATTASAYYADIIETGTRGSRPDGAKRQDAERLVRGLAARLGGTVHDQRPAMSLNLSASVYATQPLAAEQVISVLQPYTDGALFADEDQEVAGAYFLVSEQEPRFLTVYWPPRLSRSAWSRLRWAWGTSAARSRPGGSSAASSRPPRPTRPSGSRSGRRPWPWRAGWTGS